MSANTLIAVKKLGQRIWLDNLSRTLLQEGELARLIERDGIAGVTSNPAIFYKAIDDGKYYADDYQRLKATVNEPETRYEGLVIPDIQAACDLLLSQYQATFGADGYVSLEVSPFLARDEAGTIAAAKRLWEAVNRKNLMIKVPATSEGIRALESLVAEGLNVNMTLMFSLKHVEDVAHAYIRGMTRWVARGGDPRQIKSVASVFLSRVDSHIDAKLDSTGSNIALNLRGKSAVSMAKLAYQRYREIFYGAPFAELRHLGVRPQYLLWASTGTKNPSYSDVLYVESVIGTDTINTVPDTTLAAFRDHGKAELNLELGLDEAKTVLQTLQALDISLSLVGETLQAEGLKLFDEAYRKLLAKMA